MARSVADLHPHPVAVAPSATPLPTLEDESWAQFVQGLAASQSVGIAAPMLEIPQPPAAPRQSARVDPEGDAHFR